MEGTLAFPPWLDLPEPLVELILERLPIIDYNHFAAVCPKWRSIQRGHRLRHAPHPPPMANQLPWFASRWLMRHRGLECYNPSDRKTYRFPIPSSLHMTRCLASCRGWLLLLGDGSFLTPTSKQPYLINPITAAQIPLPPLLLDPWCRVVGAMSTTPMDPDCVVLLVFDRRAFMYRPNDYCAADWTIIQLTVPEGVLGGSAIYCGGKFYYSYKSSGELYIIDPFLQNAASQLVMRYPCKASIVASQILLQEIGGELFLVQMLYGSDAIKLFRVFKADLSRKKWVKVITIGDYTLFHHDDCSVLLLAADVGCKRNSIYACQELQEVGHNDVFAWGVFDLGTGGWTEEDTLMDRDFGPWFLPTLDSANPAKASD